MLSKVLRFYLEVTWFLLHKGGDKLWGTKSEKELCHQAKGRRYFARALDLTTYDLIWTAFSNLVLNLNLENNFIIGLINSYISCGIMLVLESLMLSQYGTTLGKWGFGLVIRDVDGGKLTYTQAWNQTFGVFDNGMGYNIPIVDILCKVNCYCKCKEKTPMPWEKNTSYTIKDKNAVRIIAFIGVFLVICSISYLFTLG